MEINTGNKCISPRGQREDLINVYCIIIVYHLPTQQDENQEITSSKQLKTKI